MILSTPLSFEGVGLEQRRVDQVNQGVVSASMEIVHLVDLAWSATTKFPAAKASGKASLGQIWM